MIHTLRIAQCDLPIKNNHILSIFETAPKKKSNVLFFKGEEGGREEKVEKEGKRDASIIHCREIVNDVDVAVLDVINNQSRLAFDNESSLIKGSSIGSFSPLDWLAEVVLQSVLRVQFFEVGHEHLLPSLDAHKRAFAQKILDGISRASRLTIVVCECRRQLVGLRHRVDRASEVHKLRVRITDCP